MGLVPKKLEQYPALCMLTQQYYMLHMLSPTITCYAQEYIINEPACTTASVVQHTVNNRLINLTRFYGKDIGLVFTSKTIDLNRSKPYTCTIPVITYPAAIAAKPNYSICYTR